MSTPEARPLLGRFGALWMAGPQPARGLERRRWVSVLPAPLDRTFAFFADARNLERLTPPWVRFRILTPLPVVMRAGLDLDYRIVIRGVPMPWRSRIEVWQPGVRFVDRQVWGPYRWWRHEHQFERVPEGTRVIDDVEYLPRVAWLTTGLVRRDVERIFEFRRRALELEFGRTSPDRRYS